MRPYDVKSEADLLAMESDNHPRKIEVWSILNQEDKVSLHPPARSDGRGQWVEIPRDQFNAIVDWYMRDQNPTPAPNLGSAEQERLRFQGDLDKWMKVLGAGITGYQEEAVTVMDGACEELARLRVAVRKINEIRNSIIGFQTINWSEHIYPLVAALNEAGIEGAHYPEARANVGTMLERTLAAENEAARLRAALSEIATDEEYRDLTADEAKKVARAALTTTTKEGE